MSWTSTNRAHACLSFFEKWHHEKRDVTFTAAGEWKTGFMIKSAAGESNDIRKDKAEAHAKMLDGVFTGLFGAVLENDMDSDVAVASMISILGDSSKRMKDLGDVVDSVYRFLGEVA